MKITGEDFRPVGPEIEGAREVLVQAIRDSGTRCDLCRKQTISPIRVKKKFDFCPGCVQSEDSSIRGKELTDHHAALSVAGGIRK